MNGNINIGTSKIKPTTSAPLTSFGTNNVMPYIDGFGKVNLNTEGTISSGTIYCGGTFIVAS